MKNKVQSILLLILALIGSALFWFLFEFFEVLLINSEIINYVYVGIKIFALLSIIFLWIYKYRKNEISNLYILYYLTIFLQFIPLFVRLLGQGNTSDLKSFFAVFISVVSILIYISLFITIDKSNTKIINHFSKQERHELNVVDESTYYDDEGNFRGANYKGDKNE
ncbi:hypothetical protein [Haploplasma modicum]|jgi:hypothetical protein|uniref:hypothetical protein n=1 Tax=Haploplasma modicum TaxID=2150 RepID=UPI00047E7D51|nr:hypothetical protein [Haploplasma modicum]